MTRTLDPNDWTQDEIDDDQRDHDNDVDDGSECGRWANGRLLRYCSKAGSEECDWLCPIGLPRLMEPKS